MRKELVILALAGSMFTAVPAIALETIEEKKVRMVHYQRQINEIRLGGASQIRVYNRLIKELQAEIALEEEREAAKKAEEEAKK